jgi:zinc transport system substrate-binding protein
MEPPVPLRPSSILLSLALLASPAAAAAEVVVSIQPIHALVAGVMAGMGEPRLLLPAGTSPHGYQLRPSDAAALQDADLIVWVGEDLETFLEKPIGTLARGGVLALMDAPGLTLLGSRDSGARDAQDHGDDQADPHIWLSPANARVIVAAVAAALGEADAANAAAYADNAARLTARLEALETELKAELEPVRGQPFIVLHDAFQYFEQAFGLHGAGSITVSPDRPAGARRLAELRQRIADHGAVCVFGEPQTQTQTGLVAALVDGTGIGTGELDAEGRSSLPAGAEAYFALMRGNARALADCLARAG